MICPKCNGKLVCNKTRLTNFGVLRYRKCKCGHFCKTIETVKEIRLKIVSNTGQ